MKKPICDLVSEETKRYCAEQRAKLSLAKRAAGWDYDWIYVNGRIFGAFIAPDGELFDQIFLQNLTKEN